MLRTEVGNKKDACTGFFCASLQWGGVQGGETERGKEDNINVFLLAKAGGESQHLSKEV